MNQPPAVLPTANEPCWCGSGRKYKRCHKGTEGRIQPGVISPMRTVPAHIARPPYADTGVVPRYQEDRVKSPEVIERMRRFAANPLDDAAFWQPAPLLVQLLAQGKTLT